MKIETIIYETTRGIFNVEDKLSIATVFLFCWKLSDKCFSELLYTDNPADFITSLNVEYAKYKIELTIKFSDKNIAEAFAKTRESVIEKYDRDGFYKALFHNDEYALAVQDILEFGFHLNKKYRNGNLLG